MPLIIITASSKAEQSRADTKASRAEQSRQERGEAAMADIALLVTEEFEKRVKRSGGPNGVGGEAPSSGGRNFAAVEKVLSSWVESAAATASGVRVNVAVRLKEMEPKTGLGLAAFDGFFSA